MSKSRRTRTRRSPLPERQAYWQRKNERKRAFKSRRKGA